MDLELQGMRVLVTGASDGIGLAAATLLRAEGADVAIAARNPAAAAAAIGAAAVAVDLSAPDGGERAVAGTVAALGGIDVLVNNVGTARIATFEELTDADWDDAWNLNVMSQVRCIRAALPALRDSRAAAIVNVASTSGKRPSPGMPHYSVTKAAVLSLSRLVADLYAKAGIRSNAVCPGPTLTPAWLGAGGLADQTAASSDRDRDAVLHAVGGGRPLGRMATAEEIAVVIAFLCSPRAAYVTGAAWSVDGGTVPIII
jgi:NAD(P)-dependent dehydrogenase (short-subunit alcohol dehydrogenase family)